jgi:DNA-binding LacI/PurR family transcriptional regulator
MVGIDDVARRAGVSTATVSRALSGRGHVSAEAKARVEEAAESLGYVVSAVASSLASGRARNIGVLVPYVQRWFFSTVLSGTAAELVRHGYDTTLYSLAEDAGLRRRVFDTFLRRRRVDGVIAVSIELADDEIDRLTALDLPVIALGGPDPRLSALTLDDVAVARLATEHLLALGHTRIAHIGAGPEFDQDFHIPTRRRQGFAQALTAAGLDVQGALFEPADFTIEGGFRAATRLLGRAGEEPTAIFAASDEMAIGALLAARELGRRVPGDLSVVGVDGHELGGFFQLTTVDQFPARQGRRAAAAILAALDERRSPEPGALPFELVVRATSGPPAR